jgi:phosphate transport system permease protein
MKIGKKNKNMSEVITQALFLVCGLVSVSTLFIIIFFIFSRGVPAILTVGAWDFLSSTSWSPFAGQFGILNFLAATAITTLIAFIFGSRIGKWGAIYLVFFCPPKLYRILKTTVELLGGIPSVLFGFFGVAVIVPFIRENIGGPGNSLLAAIIVLSLMILPTVINLSEAAIRSVPKVYYEGAMALGCNKTEAVFEVVVPSAKSGINAAYILGIGRAVGETMAVIMVAGNATIFPDNLLGPARTLTTAIALEMGYATGLHRDVLFVFGVVLFSIIIILNATLTIINRNATSFAKES